MHPLLREEEEEEDTLKNGSRRDVTEV